jgi:uncharacterized protein involved in type VI secretion and phage assembly
MSEVARRELASHRALALGVVTEAFSNDGGGGDHHLDCNVRLHGSELVLQHVPVAVARPGLSALPRVGDLVVLGFLDGDVNGPILLGTIHAADVPSPDAKPDEVVYEVPDTGSGSDVRRLEIKLPNGNTLTVTDDTVTVDMNGTKVVVESGGAITLEAGGDITLKANGNLKLEAMANVEIKAAASATLEASATATLKGSLTKISGMTQFGAG